MANGRARGNGGGPDARVALVVLVLVLLIGAAVAYYQHTHRVAEAPTPAPTQPAPTTTATVPAAQVTGVSTGPVNLALGNPSNATAELSNRNNYLMTKEYYTLSYNDSTGTPNWVSWRVTKVDLGNAPRKQLFDSDATLPPGFKKVAHKDYSGSGFDRGHMCPKADRDVTPDASNATFVMTNIIPQAPNVNEKAWAELEAYCRSLATRGRSTLYIVAGPTGQGGTGANGPTRTIANGKVVVPAACWKVIVVAGEDGAVTAASRVIAVIMPNDNAAVTNDDWTPYRTTAAEIETRTSLRFFTALPSPVADALRAKRDTATVRVARSASHAD
jgi:endonuclease G